MSDIPPDFGYKEFETEEEALDFVNKFEFVLIEQRSDFDIYETKDKQKVRANLYQDKNGQWVVAQQMREIIS